MNFWILDTETTGLKSPSGVVEFSARRIDGTTLELLEHRHSMCNPGMPIEPGAQAIHGISDMDIMDAPKIETVFKLEGPIVAIAHNWSYDAKYLSEHIDNLVGSLCTLALARQYITDSANHKLGTLAAHLNLEVGTAHRAAGDTHTTHGLLKHLVQTSGRTLSQLVDAARKPQVIHKLSFGKFKGQMINTIPKWYIEWFLEQPDIDKDLRFSLSNELKTR